MAKEIIGRAMIAIPLIMVFGTIICNIVRDIGWILTLKWFGVVAFLVIYFGVAFCLMWN